MMKTFYEFIIYSILESGFELLNRIMHNYYYILPETVKSPVIN